MLDEIKVIHLEFCYSPHPKLNPAYIQQAKENVVPAMDGRWFVVEADGKKRTENNVFSQQQSGSDLRSRDVGPGRKRAAAAYLAQPEPATTRCSYCMTESRRNLYPGLKIPDTTQRGQPQSYYK